MQKYDVSQVRKDFPILGREVHGQPLVYLDNGASAQKPQIVIDTVTRAYANEYSNVHRGLHFLSTLATEKFEAVRETLRAFLSAKTTAEIVYTTGTTEAMNLVARAWGHRNLKAGDEVILSIMEHHANIVPWHFLREELGIKIVWVETDATGALPVERVIDAFTDRTRVVAITHMSNVLGTVVDVKAIASAAREKGIVTVIDGSQAAVHMAVDVVDLNCDFYAITGHKLYGPSASGALYIRSDRHDEMGPFMGGGDMIRTVSRDAVTYNDAPHKFEAGTPAIVQMIGLGAAIDYVQGLGLDAIAAHEAELRDYAQSRLSGLNWLSVHGTAPGKGAIFSFAMNGVAHAHDISTVLDQKGIAVRAGHHCAQPLMDHLGVSATARASFGLYNTTEEVDALIDALELCHDLFS
ncbi:MAG: cysteine desulfurase [Pseudomonadota bacterium]